MTEAPRRAARRKAKTRRRVSVVGVLGELLITAGALVLLFLGWQLWLNDIIQGEKQQDIAEETSKEWDEPDFLDKAEATLPPVVSDPGEPVVREEPAMNAKVANLYVPRFGADYAKTIYQGVDLYDVLDIGIGHYPDTQMPGEIGNFALAAHRTTWGKPFAEIAELRLGDEVYVETPDGWYVYEFRSLEYVRPTGVGVIDPVPQMSGIEPTDRILTMTSCNPLYSAAERIIAYTVFDRWVPRADGPPQEIAGVVQAGGK